MKQIPIKSIASAILAICAFLPGPSAFGQQPVKLPTVAQQNALNPRIYLSIYANAPVSYGSVFLWNVPAGSTVQNGVGYPGWCVDSFSPISAGGTYFPVLYSSLDTAALASAGIPTLNWDKVNYVLNNKPVGATASDIQDAIWSFIGGGGHIQADLRNPAGGHQGLGFVVPSPAVVNAIIAKANLDGGGYTPPPGGVLAVVLNLPTSLNSNVQYQRFIIEVKTPSGAIGDFVWKDLNANGLQDANEPGIDNVPVTLMDSNNVVIATTTTSFNAAQNSHGFYQFNRLVAGTYKVQVDNNAPALAGCAPTTPNVGLDRSLDSNPNAATVVLATDSSFDYSIDFGYVASPASGRLGDFVWKDLNGNGIQDTGEAGINGVTVRLKDLGNNVLATTTTGPHPAVFGAAGYYQFQGLTAGSYKVEVDNTSAALAGCVPTTLQGTMDLAKDSNANPFTVTLPTNSSSDQTIDFGYVASTPGFTLTKSVNKTTVNVFETVDYTYTVRNTGATTLTNVTITDDNATPNFPGDDFTVASGVTLLPGAQMSFVVTGVPPVAMCAPVNSVSTISGTLITEILANGDVKVTYRQSLDLVDNTYGSNASAGWRSGHTFGNFTGSDNAQLQFINRAGVVVNESKFDYITANAAYPSGYGTLGAAGGDGRLITGSLSDIVSVDTTMTKNLNQSPAFYGYIVNSPAPPASFPTWDYVDGYTVVLKGSAFGASGFGKVNVVGVHNSPAKTGAGLHEPVPCDTDATNIATGTATAGGVTMKAQASATVHVIGLTQGGGGNVPPKLTTYKQDDKGWDGSAAGALLSSKFGALYPGGLTVGGTFTLKFTSAAAVQAFLPASGGAKALTSSAVNPTKTTAGELAGQVVALKLNVDFSNAGFLQQGLANLKLTNGKLKGSTVTQVLTLANQVLGGGALPAGVSISDVSSAAKTINENYDQSKDKGDLAP